ncbi:MAG: ROK family protein, partial [Mariprofundaceae bacterium]
MSGRVVLAADVGGTNLRLAIVDEAGRIVEDIRCGWKPQGMDNDTLVRKLADAMRPLVERHRPAAAGIGFPGFVSDGVLAASPNLPGVRDLPLAARLERALGLPVGVENDALCAAVGEHAFGAGGGAAHLLH